MIATFTLLQQPIPTQAGADLAALTAPNAQTWREQAARIDELEAEVSRLERTAHDPTTTTSTYEVTAYTAGPESTGKSAGDPAYGVTASGEPVQEGVTVACPPEMAFGTVLSIEGVGERVCTDRGGAIKGKRLDVYISSLSEAREFGRQILRVEKGADE